MIAFLICLFLLISANPALAQLDLHEFVREVQHKNMRTYESIDALSFAGRAKIYSYVNQKYLDLDNVLAMEEFYFEGLWQRPDSLRIKVTGYRKYLNDILKEAADSTGKTENEHLKIEDKFPLPDPMKIAFGESVIEADVTGRLKNLDEENTWPVHPFALGADSLYEYTQIGEVGFDIRKLRQVRVRPKNNSIPGIAGVFLIDRDEKVVVGSDYVFNDAARIKSADLARVKKQSPIMGRLLSYEESFSVKSNKVLFNGDYWLPIEHSEEILINVLNMKGRIFREIEFTRFEINPDSLTSSSFSEEKVTYARDSLLEKNLFVEGGMLKSLDRNEEDLIRKASRRVFRTQKIFADISGPVDPSMIAGETFMNSIMGSRSVKLAGKLSDSFVYNRIEGLRLQDSIQFINVLSDNSVAGISAAYGINDTRLKGEISWTKFFGKDNRFNLSGRVYSGLLTNDDPREISTFTNSLSSILLRRDCRDYLYAEGFRAGLSYIGGSTSIALSYIYQDEYDARSNTGFGLFNRKNGFRPNPAIIEGTYSGIRLNAGYILPFGNLEFTAEYSDNNRLGSDFDFLKVCSSLSIEADLNRFSEFEMTLFTGLSGTELPTQHWFDTGGKILFGRTGRLRGTGFKSITGDQMIYGVIEFPVYPFRISQVKKRLNDAEFIKRNIKIVPWAGFAWSSLTPVNRMLQTIMDIHGSEEDKVYFEFGIGLADRLNLFRIDIIHTNRSGSKIQIGFNFLR